MTIDANNKLADWVSKLVQIPSITPSQAGGKLEWSGESLIARQTAGWFEAFGGEVYLEEVAENRPNVYGIWRGQTDKWVAVDIHLDTVGVEQMTIPPFEGKITNDRVYGRGAADTKATLGVMLSILEEIYANHLKLIPNLLVTGTADEEVDGLGAPAFAKWVHKRKITLDELLVAEPTLCHPVYGHKGEIRMTFTVHGKSAHSSKPHLGENAVVAAAKLVLELDRENTKLQKETADSLLGPATLATTVVDGGTGLNVIPDFCNVSIDRRTLPGECMDEIVQDLTQKANNGCPLRVSTKVLSALDAFYQPKNTPLIEKLAGWSELEPDTVSFGTNAWAYKDLARECVVIGPGSIEQAHGQEEWISILELQKMHSILKRWLGLSV